MAVSDVFCNVVKNFDGDNISNMTLYVILSRDSNLGPKPLSLLEFETGRLRLLGHHGRFQPFVYAAPQLSCFCSKLLLLLQQFGNVPLALLHI